MVAKRVENVGTALWGKEPWPPGIQCFRLEKKGMKIDKKKMDDFPHGRCFFSNEGKACVQINSNGTRVVHERGKGGSWANKCFGNVSEKGRISLWFPKPETRKGKLIQYYNQTRC